MRVYNYMWSRVNEVVNEARLKVIEVVEEICKLIRGELTSLLDELAREFGFTYVIKPRIGDGNLWSIVPCIFIESSQEVYERVTRIIKERYAELVSESRLAFELKPTKPKIE